LGRSRPEGSTAETESVTKSGRASSQDHTYRDLLEAMDDGVLLVDDGDKIRFSNPAAQGLLSSIPTSVAGLPGRAFQEICAQARATRQSTSIEIEVAAPTHWLRATATPIGTAGDERASLLLVIQDVTEARRLEAVRRDFVANASHELKTPVASIQVTAETLRHAAADDPEALIRFTKQLERESLRLSRIVEDLLDLSRLEAAPRIAHPTPFDAVVVEETGRFEDAALEANITLSHQVAPIQVMAPESDLRLLVRNLVDNACRYTSDGTVTVTLTREGNDAVLAVRDTGVGIPTGDLPRIFERFYRVDRARSRETGGTGLGLAIVKHVADNLHGTAEATSELGQGSQFVVTIPLDPNEQPPLPEPS